MEFSNRTEPIAAIVCGYERGGTTLLSQILRQHPSLSSGFECGFLLADDISKFPDIEPFATMIKPGWNINENDVEYICQADSWVEAYKRLQQRSPLCENGEGNKIFDKTPKYMEQLSSVMRKLPDVPCIVLVRDPRAVLWSWAKRSELSVEKWAKHHLSRSCDRYNSYANGWLEASESDLSSRILLVQYEELCTSQIENSRKIFDFIDVGFEETFLEFSENTKRFNNVYGGQVSSEYLCEYENNFSDEICCEILDATGRFSKWFWNG